ncbi:MAG: hypothetical protein HC933_01585 [Pleurocapsa sp. SU_196_0]|nr:hypothetical protein [Pleurocapsa sp. SU_196_0]
MLGRIFKSIQSFLESDDDTEVTPDKKASADSMQLKHEGDTATLHVKLGGKDGLDSTQTKGVRSKFKALLENQAPQQQLLSAADDLMMDGAYLEAIEAYREVERHFPETRHWTNNNTGGVPVLPG